MYKLSPSDFAYLYEDCKHCYYLKVKYGLYQPSMPMPGVFSAINTRLQGNMVGKNLRDLSSDLPDGIVESQEGWVESIVVPETSVYIKGKYDLLVKCLDGSHMLVDLKISQPNEEKIDKYMTQLMAYKFALENPNQGERVDISRMGLLIFYPDTVNFENNTVLLDFPPKWLEIPTDKRAFWDFMKEIDKLLKGDLPEEENDCKWCDYLKRRAIIEGKESKIHQDLPF
jgi:hypothetical protein